MFNKVHFSSILAGILVCSLLTACAGTGGMEPTSPPPPEPTAPGESSSVVAQGEFTGADASHQGSGTATIVQREGGDLVLQLEDFSVTDGPDLYVYLTGTAAPASGDDLGDIVDLGLLRNPTGDQEYDIPDDTAVEDYSSVVIYCLAYEVLFAYAPLSPSASLP